MHNVYVTVQDILIVAALYWGSQVINLKNQSQATRVDEFFKNTDLSTVAWARSSESITKS